MREQSAQLEIASWGEEEKKSPVTIAAADNHG
jgi:hypothetical protein